MPSSPDSPPSTAQSYKSPDASRLPCFVGAFGAPFSGKSYRIKQILAASTLAAAVIFDPGHEYDGRIFENEIAWMDAIDKQEPGAPWVLRPPFDSDIRVAWFDAFCETALALARATGRCTCVIDELHLVTEASRAPKPWAELTLTGRKFGAEILIASVRPALIDKNFWTIATNIQTGRLNFQDDQRTLANALGVDLAEINALTDHAWIRRDMLSGAVTRG
jgi:hypothetical protein